MVVVSGAETCGSLETKETLFLLVKTRCHGNTLLKVYRFKFRLNRALLFSADGCSLRAHPVSGVHEQNYLYKMDLRDFNPGDEGGRTLEQKNCSKRDT